MRNNTLAISKLPKKSGEKISMGNVHGAANGLIVTQVARTSDSTLLIIVKDMLSAERLLDEIRFFDPELSALIFPDWETLPFDSFSPHQDIISQRLQTLSRLTTTGHRQLLIVPVSSLMHRLMDQQFLSQHSFVLRLNDQLDPQHLSMQLTANGYRNVSQVMEHGEFSIRGSIVDIFPMGSATPYRIDLFDDEVDSIRVFDAESQVSIDKVSEINLLPAKEYPLDEDGVRRFRQSWRATFEGNPANSPLYESISEGISAPGIEYYLPLFFDQTSTLFDFLPEHSTVMLIGDVYQSAQEFWAEINNRHEQLRGDIERPLLSADLVFVPVNELFANIKQLPVVQLSEVAAQQNADTAPELSVTIHPKNAQPYSELIALLERQTGRFLFVAESVGRREILLDHLKKCQIQPASVASWPEFLDSATQHAIITAPIEHGLTLLEPAINIITEAQLFGDIVKQRKRKLTRVQDPQTIIRNLTELSIDAPVVHIEHGIGRYQGLQTIQTGDLTAEYLCLHYANSDKLFVPVADLHLISRYTGSESAPLHQLGSKRWQKIKEKAAKRVRDAAAELLDIYARREAKTGTAMHINEHEYQQFATSFAFEETPDQEKAITDVITDLSAARAMDRLVCGDVGFGKTEVAMRAAFVCANNNAQVAILVPTTLLCEQHLQNFQDRFAHWPIKIAGISRFRSKKEQDAIMMQVADGKVDIVIGTHKLLSSTFNFKQLGLLIIDEEHRFGVRQKEKIKSLRTDVDILTLTATPIPRTLNMSMTGMRDLSIIATPPARRLSIVTFVRQYQDGLVREAILREILRGGQVYFLNNDVQSIARVAHDIEKLVPEAKCGIAHGQMREKELEKVMADFYHRRFNVLVCTTIVESGIDVPSANTMIIQRADKFGLAQLHQLRGRVGRSHHQAYAYLLTPPESVMTKDAQKRLEAISSLGDLGSGFALATNDLEIRGAGEILGDEQSGHIQEIGFSLYMEMLEVAVKALKSGKEPELLAPLHAGPEMDLQISALIPDHFIPDIKLRLSLYKRISNAENEHALGELRAEMIDRFGPLPEMTINLFEQTRLKLLACEMGMTKCVISQRSVRIELDKKPNINVERLIGLVQAKPDVYRFEGTDKIRYTLSEMTPEQKFTQLGQFFNEIRIGAR